MQHAAALVGHHPHIGRHARHQAPIGIRKTNYRHIRDHIGHVERGLAHLAHLALKALARKGVHRKTRLLPGLHAAHIALVNGGVHLHVGQVFGDDEKLGRLQAAGHRLAALYGPLDHNAAHGRGNAGARQVNAGLRQSSVALGHGGLRRADLGLRHAHLRLRCFERLLAGVNQGARLVALAHCHKLLVHQHVGTVLAALGLVQVHLRTRHLGLHGHCVGLGGEHGGAGGLVVRLGRANAVLKTLRVDLRQQLPGLDLGVEIHQHVANLTAHLRAHGHQGHRVERATGGHHRLQIAPGDFAGAVLHRRQRRTRPPPHPGASGQKQGQSQRNLRCSFHAFIVGSGDDTGSPAGLL